MYNLLIKNYEYLTPILSRYVGESNNILHLLQENVNQLNLYNIIMYIKCTTMYCDFLHIQELDQFR